ncbi:MAG: hypothetical protein QOE80_4379, partial [Actinomycetota bacterium]|nr:hypothetical protein [Actinomycetota bacterium]
RATATQAALDQAVSAQEEAVGRLDEAVTARDRAIGALAETKAALDDSQASLAGTKAALAETKDVLDDTTAALRGTKAKLGETKAALADTKATLGATKTTLAETNAALADTKATLAGTKAALADTKATLADTEAALADGEGRIAMLEADLETVRADRDALVAAQTQAAAGRGDAVDALAARAEGAVVVLPGVDLPEAATAPPTPARVSWQPTWSEWASDADTSAAPADPAPAPVRSGLDDVDVADPADDSELMLDDVEEGAVRRYLNVAATIGQLLPDDFGPLLLSGASVVRREGRLFAIVAVPADRWAAPGSDGAEQAKKLADAGFRVEWTTVAPLAC